MCEKFDIRKHITPNTSAAIPTTQRVIWVVRERRICDVSVMSMLYLLAPTIFFKAEPKMIYWVLPAMVPSFCPQRKGQSS